MVSATSTAHSAQSEGYMYVHGRDIQMRPLFISDASKMLSVPGPKKGKPNIEAMLNLLAFQCYYVENYLFLPGQVENWVTICDMSKASISSLPREELAQVAQLMQEQYPCRMGRSWILNTTTLIMMVWKFVSMFIDKEVKAKVHLSSKGSMADLTDFFHPCQLP